MTADNMNLPATLRKLLENTDQDLLRAMLQTFAQALMGAEVNARCGADYQARSDDRVNKRNGYRERRWDSRLGSIDLAIPKLRRGTYFPAWLLEPRRRSERALLQVVVEAYVHGVSTRRVDDLVTALGVEGMSKSQVSELAQDLDRSVEAFRSRPLVGPYRYVWVDALAVKAREEGRTVNVATVIAVGVNPEGKREILGVDVLTEESAAGWTAFLRALTARGLTGVELVTSDAHKGIQHAIAAALPGASWQRCRTHFMRNLLTTVPKAAQDFVATLVRSVYAQQDKDSVRATWKDIRDRIAPRFPKTAQLLDDARDDVLAFADFPKAHWKQIWSNNPQERLNKEIRRRTDVVGIFPNRAAVLRLIGAVLAEQHDEWSVQRVYLTPDAHPDRASNALNPASTAALAAPAPPAASAA